MPEIATLVELAARAYLRSDRDVPKSGITDEVREALARGDLRVCVRRCDESSLNDRRPVARLRLKFVWYADISGVAHWISEEGPANDLRGECGIESGILSVYLDGGLCTHLTGDRGIVKRHAIACAATRCPVCLEIVALSPKCGSRRHRHSNLMLKFVFPWDSVLR